MRSGINEKKHISSNRDLEFLGEGESPKENVSLDDELSEHGFSLTWKNFMTIIIVLIGSVLF
jgi:hypothetical protein